jgi:hypothetical protein
MTCNRSNALNSPDSDFASIASRESKHISICCRLTHDGGRGLQRILVGRRRKSPSKRVLGNVDRDHELQQVVGAARFCADTREFEAAKVFKWVKERNYKVVLPTREVYLKGPGKIFRKDPKNDVTEIQVPVEG